MKCEFHKIEKLRQEMNKYYDSLVRELQDTCPHEELTNWMIGHNSDVRLCKRCMKTIELEPRPYPWGPIYSCS